MDLKDMKIGRIALAAYPSPQSRLMEFVRRTPPKRKDLRVSRMEEMVMHSVMARMVEGKLRIKDFWEITSKVVGRKVVITLDFRSNPTKKNLSRTK